MTSILKVDNIQKANGSTPKANDLGINTTGTVLQVLQTSTTTAASIAQDAFTTTGFTLTITPSKATSKVLLTGNLFLLCPNGAQASINIYDSISSGFITSQAYGLGGPYFASAGYYECVTTFSFLASVNSTSARTYTIYGRSTGTDPAVFYASNRLSTFTAMEIGG